MDYLKMKPRAYLCPYCGETHLVPNSIKPLGTYREEHPLVLPCEFSFDRERKTIVFFDDYTFTLRILQVCRYVEKLEDVTFNHIYLDSKVEVEGRAIKNIGKCRDRSCIDCRRECVCKDCDFRNECYPHHHSECKRCGFYEMRFGFVFDDEEKVESTETNTVDLEQEGKMTEKTFSALMRNHMEEDIEFIKDWTEKHKEWIEKHKSTLQWAVPVVSIYAAYRILKSPAFASKLGKLGNECEEKLGFSLEQLKDKKALKELMVLGGATAGAYAAIKGVSSIFNTNNEINAESVEEGMSQLEKIHEKFAWITPKTEKLLPVAVSVIVFYMMTQKPELLEGAKEKTKSITEDLACKASVYLEMVKLFVADKLKIDLSNEEEIQKLKRFAVLAGVATIGLFLYGTRTGEDEKKVDGKEAFVRQILDIMRKLMPTAFAGAASYLVAKNLIPKEYAEVQPAEDKIVNVDVD